MQIKIAGAGLVGSLAAVYFARQGHSVTLYERRPDMRTNLLDRGRSINLAVSVRGIHALKEVDLEKSILEKAIPMKGRMVHALDGSTSLLPYGKKDSEYIQSISRAELNKNLMTAAEKLGVKFHFNRALKKVDFRKHLAEFEGAPEVPFDLLVGTDGAFSSVRSEMNREGHSKSTENFLDYGYKEFHIPPLAGGRFQMERNALHIWPRGKFMLIALPNFDGSFTCTLFMPYKGDSSFETLADPGAVTTFFKTYFPDAPIEDLEKTFTENPTGSMVTVRTDRWHYEGNAFVAGDAAHAIVPFFGQGMNCGFEDLTEFERQGGFKNPSKELLATWAQARKPNADAIADMAIENFTEMRDLVADPVFLKKKEIEKRIERELTDDQYVSRYRLVSFSRTPYLHAYEVGELQKKLLADLYEKLDASKNVASLSPDLIRAAVDKHLHQFFETHLKGRIPWN